MLNNIFAPNGNVKETCLQITPRTRENKESVLHARTAACRLLQAADLLDKNEFIGLEFGSYSDRYDISMFFSETIDLESEDINWIMDDCAKSTRVRNNTLFDLRDDESTVYAIYSQSEDKRDPDEISEANSADYFNQLVDEILKTDGFVRLTIERHSAEDKPRITVIAALWEKISFREKTMVSAALPGLIIRELSKCNGEYVSEDYSCNRNSCIELIEKSFIKFMDIEGVIEVEEDLNSLTDVILDKARDVVLDRYDMCDDTCIEALNLSVRSYNCLKRASINTLGELRELSDYDLTRIRNLGKKSYIEIKAILTRLDLEHIGNSSDEVILENLYNEGSAVEEMIDAIAKNTDSSEETAEENKENESDCFACCMSELDELIGLTEVKEQVKRIVAFAEMQKDIKSMGSGSVPVALNMEFTGNPGTAKTTVSRILARIFHSIGIIRDREIMEVGRSDLVAEYVGQTAIKVRQVFERAEGRLLFIDEAYSLLDSQRNSFADEAISTIVQEMENRREDTIVIFAGYPDKMKEMFSVNPGLRSRVPFSISFKDYSADEMTQIAKLEAKRRGFIIGDSARPKLMSACAAAAGDPEKGNGRFCRNIIEKSILEYAVRVYGSESANVKKDFVLREEDFNILNDSKTEPKKNPSPERRKIGFVV